MKKNYNAYPFEKNPVGVSQKNVIKDHANTAPLPRKKQKLILRMHALLDWHSRRLSLIFRLFVKHGLNTLNMRNRKQVRLVVNQIYAFKRQGHTKMNRRNFIDG